MATGCRNEIPTQKIRPLPAWSFRENYVIEVFGGALNERYTGVIFPVPHRLFEKSLVCTCTTNQINAHPYIGKYSFSWHKCIYGGDV
jgi:hypothetical protein